jgi:hypothetical protein
MDSVFDVVATIVHSNPSIEYLTLVRYIGGKNWGDRAQTPEAGKVEWSRTGMKQDRGERVLTKLSREEVSPESLHELAKSLSEDKLLGILSKVSLLNEEAAHIPRMDFKCATSPENLETLRSLLKDLRLGRGFLLESGRSYHYYGIKLLDEKEWQVFLGRCLLMSGYSDDRYIGHQLVDGYCVLRLSSGRWKKTPPTVAAELL